MEKNISGDTDKTIVMDAGIATKENILWLKRNNYHYIVVQRGNPPSEKDFSDRKTIREDRNRNTARQIKRFVVAGDAYILCKSRKKTAKEQAMRVRIEALYQERMNHLALGLTKRRRTKNYQKVMKMIGKVQEKYPAAAKLYEVKIIPEKGKAASDPTVKAVKLTWREKVLKSESEQQEIIFTAFAIPLPK